MKCSNAYGVKIEKLTITLRHWYSSVTGAYSFSTKLFLNDDTEAAVVMNGHSPHKPSSLDILHRAVTAGKLPKPEGNLSSLAYLKKLGVAVALSDMPVKNRKDLNANR